MDAIHKQRKEAPASIFAKCICVGDSGLNIELRQPISGRTNRLRLGTGKTSLAVRFVTKTFDEEQTSPTLGVEKYGPMEIIVRKQRVLLNIWDTVSCILVSELSSNAAGRV